MEIIIGKTSGFCAGVKNAVEKVEKELKKSQKELYCLGELVHNRQVIEKLEKKGLKVINKIEETKGETIIRAHGIEKNIYEKAKKDNIKLIDYTCPKVIKIHEIAEEYSEKGYFIIFIGVSNHPETIGTISFCGKHSYLLEDIEDIEKCLQKVKKSKIKNILIIAQTTYNLSKFDQIINKIEEELLEDCKIEVINTICAATRIRQEETEKISKSVECMIIVGGKNSSNTKKLYEVSKKNCKNVVLIETVKELNIKEIRKYKKIGIMAGASTPNESITDIKKALMGGTK